MARPHEELHALLADIPGVDAVYFQAPTDMEYPCIVFQRSRSFTLRANNALYLLKKAYTVTVIDRAPDSLIPDRVEELPYASFDRFYRVDGLNHFVFQLYF